MRDFTETDIERIEQIIDSQDKEAAQNEMKEMHPLPSSPSYSIMTNRVFLIIVTCLLLSACAGGQHDRRLTYIAGIVSDAPETALDSLQKIEINTLSDADRHFHDFLTIKAMDKAYYVHKSDSLILDVIDYYSHQKSPQIYAEALYYAGRVYSDLGDTPTALRYFHSALETLPQKPENRMLRGIILSQTGRLFNTLRLYDEAVPYLEKSLEIDKALNDSVGEVYDLQLLGSIYMRSEDFGKAESKFRKAFEKSRNLGSKHMAKSSMYMAGVKLRKGEIDSALIYIRNTPEQVSPIARNSSLAEAVNIYNAAGIPDTAYYYAQQLINSRDSLNKKWGYYTLLSSELRSRVDPDTVDAYVTSLMNIIEKSLDDHGSQLAISQQAFYNYQIHERERIKADKRNAALRNCLIATLFIILLCVIAILYYKNRNNRNIIVLRTTLDNLDRLKQELHSIPTMPSPDTDSHKPNATVYTAKTPTAETLRDQLRKELIALSQQASGEIPVSEKILNSAIYSRLQTMIAHGQSIGEDNEVWERIEEIVLESSPKFLTNLSLLTSGNLSTTDLHTALLIKCGFKRVHMTTLLGRSNGAIGSRRDTLSIKIYDTKLESAAITNIIRSL